jgi:hypothetical protein
MTIKTEKIMIMATAVATPENYGNRETKTTLTMSMIIDGLSIMIALLCSGVAAAEVR